MKTNVQFDFKSTMGEAVLSQFAVNVLNRMKGNPRFVSLKTLVETDLQSASDRFALALQEAADGSRTKIAEKRVYRAELVHLLEKIATHLVILADGSEAVVLEAGFNPRRKPQRNDSEPDQVTGLRASAGAHSGEVLLEYRPVPRARVYGIEWSLDEGQHWQNGVYPSARRATVSGLPVRQEVLFRVFAVGSQQRKGAPSVPVRCFVL